LQLQFLSESSASKSIKVTAGLKRMHIIEEYKCNEKRIDSKVRYLKGTTQSTSPVRELELPPMNLPEPIPPSTDDNDFQVAFTTSFRIHTQ
jgi:hypothetical protein